MDFDEYVQQMFAIIDANSRDEKQTALLVRRLTQGALSQEGFVLSCVKRIIAPMAESASQPWRNPPLFGSRDERISIRVFYWPPGFGNQPHLHDCWTVTAVLHNFILAETFRGATSVDDINPGQSQQFSAHTGMVGFLLPPCIHRLINTSDRESATFHVFCNTPSRKMSDGEPGTVLAADTSRTVGQSSQPTPHYGAARRRALSVVVQMLAAFKSVSPIDLLEQIFAVGENSIKLQVVKALASRAPAIAYQRSCELQCWLHGNDAVELCKINAEFARMGVTPALKL